MESKDSFSEFRSGTPTKKPATQVAFDEFRSHESGTPKDDAFKGLHEPAKDAPRRDEYPEFRSRDALKSTDAFAGFRSPAPVTASSPAHDEFPEYRENTQTETGSSSASTPSAAAPQEPIA